MTVAPTTPSSPSESSAAAPLAVALDLLPLAPRPQAARLLGAFFQLVSDPLAFMTMASTSGPLARVRIFRETLVFVSEPALIHQVLVGRASEMLKDRITQKLQETLGNGLLTSEGAFWRSQRKLMAPLFSRKQLAGYAATMVERTELAVAQWQAGEQRDFHLDSMALTLDIIFRTVFGSEMPAGAAERMSHAIELMMDQFEKELRTWRRLVPATWLRKGRARAAHARSELDSIVYDLIARKRQEGAGGDDLVSRLLSARSEEGQAMSDLQVRDEAVTMVVAGHETTALVLTFSTLLLSDWPQVAERLRAELAEVLQGRSPSLEDLPRLPYTRAVVLESMRLFPPAYVIGRQALAPFELGGYRIAAGDQLLIAQWALHRNPQWFQDPASFVPERWLGDLEQTLPAHVYLPFGGGPRICIGQHFAMMEAVLCLATLAQRVSLQAVPGQSRELSPAVTLRPRHGLKVTVRRLGNVRP